MAAPQLDEIDFATVKHLQDHARMSNVEPPASACRQRRACGAFQALEKAGVSHPQRV